MAFIFSTTGNAKIKVSGNIETLLDYQTVENGQRPTMGSNCYASLFANANLTSAPELPATTLAMFCYLDMFAGCKNLTTAPTLPATTLAMSCYSAMFSGCTSLTTAPELPSTTLASGCYASMFYGCTSLTTAPELPATTLPDFCYWRMFIGCTSLKISSASDSTYRYAYRIPASGTGTTTASNALDNMFASTGGTFKGTPTINTTYYTDHQPV